MPWFDSWMTIVTIQTGRFFNLHAAIYCPYAGQNSSTLIWSCESQRLLGPLQWQCTTGIITNRNFGTNPENPPPGTNSWNSSGICDCIKILLAWQIMLSVGTIGTYNSESCYYMNASTGLLVRLLMMHVFVMIDWFHIIINVLPVLFGWYFFFNWSKLSSRTDNAYCWQSNIDEELLIFKDQMCFC